MIGVRRPRRTAFLLSGGGHLGALGCSDGRRLGWPWDAWTVDGSSCRRGCAVLCPGPPRAEDAELVADERGRAGGRVRTGTPDPAGWREGWEDAAGRLGGPGPPILGY